MSNKLKSENRIDMLNGPVALRLLLFAIPLAASSILQQLFNAADVAVVGKFAGDVALAAVGANTPVASLFINAFVGISVGTNVVIAQYIGRGESDNVGKVVHTSVLFALISGAVLMVVGILAAAPIHSLISTPGEVMAPAVLYLRIYFLGIPFAVLFNFGAAILRSIGDTKRPMLCLFFSGIVNLILNLVFVIVFKMGVAGVAIATAISNIVSAALVARILLKEESIVRVEKDKLAIDKRSLVAVIKMGGPAAIQSMVFSVSNICLQAGLNSLGKSAIAGAAAAVNFELLDFYVINAYNQAAVTFIGQNYAAGKIDRCKKIFGVCIAESMLCMSCMMLVFFLGRSFWMELFTSDAAVFEYGVTRMKIALIPQVLAALFEITGSTMRGEGRSMSPAMITMVGSVGIRILWLVTVFKIWHTFQALTLVYPVSWMATNVMMIILFLLTRKEAWGKRN